MKRILEVINLATSAENFIGSQFSYLSEMGGYEMHLICSAGDNIEALAKQYGFKYKILPINRNITPVQDVKSLIGICKYIRNNKIDIIIAHQEKGNLLGQLAGFIMNVPIRIILAHGILYESMHGIKRWLIKKQDTVVSLLATNVICVSNFVRDTRLKDGVDKPKKSIVLGRGSCNGIDVNKKFTPEKFKQEDVKALREMFCIGETDFVIGFCGRLVKDKGIEELVQAHKMLVSEYPGKRIILFVIGKLETRDAISRETINYLECSDTVIFTGHVPYSDIEKYYLPMDVFILPSHRDGLGLTPLEAQAMGVPAIVTNFTGCAETILNGVTGEYIDLNPRTIASVISHFFDKGKSIDYGKRGREFVCNNFNRETVNEKMLEYIKSLHQKN